MQCSAVQVLSWYEHVLPQLRGRSFYGSKLKEFIQGPGETVYMPVSIHTLLCSRLSLPCPDPPCSALTLPALP